jgi:hypothetical protein
MTAAHLFAMKDLLRRSSGSHEDTALFYSNQVKKTAFKKKKLTKYFVEKLLVKLQINGNVIQKCMKAPLSAFAKIMKLSHDIVTGKAGFGQLSTLSTILCDDLKIIPEKLNDSAIFNDVRNYMNNHIQNK